METIPFDISTLLGEPQVYTVDDDNLEEIQRNHNLGENGVEDMVDLVDLNESALLWNLKIRYQKQLIYVSLIYFKNFFADLTLWRSLIPIGQLNNFLLLFLL